jgi:hypothetical protein
MKKVISTTAFVFLAFFVMGQSGHSTLITIHLKNSAWLPRKCTLISYAPGETGNGTQSYWLLPGTSKEWKFLLGTKLYLANQKQVDIMMGGKSIDNGKPFLVIKKEDDNKTFKF